MTWLTIEELTDQALEAFWGIVVKHYSQAKTGDLSPLTTHQLSVAAKNAIKEWIWANVRIRTADEEE